MTNIYIHVRTHTHGLICVYTTYINPCVCIQKRETTAATQYSKGDAVFCVAVVVSLFWIHTHV